MSEVVSADAVLHVTPLAEDRQALVVGDVFPALTGEQFHDRAGKLLDRQADAGDGKAIEGKVGAEADEKEMPGIGDPRGEGGGADGVDEDVTERVGATLEDEACAFFDTAGQAVAEG